MEKFCKSEGRDGLKERGRRDQEEKKGRGKRKLKTESCKVETAKFLSCCFQDFVLKMKTCSFFERSKFGKANRGRNDFWPNLSQQLGCAGDNFTVEMRQVWRQA